MNRSIVENFTDSRKVGCPLIGVSTSDPAALIKLLTDSIPKDKDVGLIRWDAVNGLAAINESGRRALDTFNMDEEELANNSGAPGSALRMVLDLPPNVIVFFLNAHLFYGNEIVKQAIWNARDALKSRKSTLVLLGPELQLPPEIARDVVLYDDALPNRPQLADILNRQLENAGLDGQLSDLQLEQSVDACLGLGAFEAETAIALSIAASVGKKKIDAVKFISTLWERKRHAVEQTQGLSVWSDTTTFDDVMGVENAKFYITRYMQGPARARVILWLDEMEKSLAGIQGDTSGVSQDQLMAFLTFMQDYQARGLLFVGHAGCSKSYLIKAIGGTFQIPVVKFDMGGMKNSLVGQSEQAVRTGLKVCHAIGGGKVLVVATVNDMKILPPELRRRFNMGVLMFDIPTAEERNAVAQYYLKKYNLGDAEMPDMEGWTQAEVEQVCDRAWALNLPPKEAAQFVTPIINTARDKIDALRKQAHQKFISASRPGLYEMPKEPPQERRYADLT